MLLQVVWGWGIIKMVNTLRVIPLIILCLSHSVYAADTGTTAKEIKASQYTKCASSALTTGLIKTAFNQQSDRESQILTYGGLGMALYAGWYSSPEYALSSYKEHQHKLQQDSLKYIRNGSRNEIYNFTVSYLVPKNEKCFPLFKELEVAVVKNKSSFDNFKQSEQAKKLIDGVMQSAQEMVIGKTPIK